MPKDQKPTPPSAELTFYEGLVLPIWVQDLLDVYDTDRKKDILRRILGAGHIGWESVRIGLSAHLAQYASNVANTHPGPINDVLGPLLIKIRDFHAEADHEYEYGSDECLHLDAAVKNLRDIEATDLVDAAQELIAGRPMSAATFIPTATPESVYRFIVAVIATWANKSDDEAFSQ